MRRLPRPMFWLAACALAATAHGRPASAGDGLADEDREILAWLDTTGLPSAAGKPWVHVTMGEFELGDPFVREEPEKRRPEVVKGLLLDETSSAWTVLPANALARTIEKPLGGVTRPAGPIALTSASFADDVRLFLADLASGASQPLGGWPADFEEHVGTRAEAVILARVALALDQPSLAHDLLAGARAVREPADEKGGGRTLLERVRADLSTPVFGRVIVDFGRPEIPRTTLAERIRRYVDAFPGGEHIERAKATLVILEKMVGEDEARAKQERPFDSLSRSEQIDDLVFQLRNQNGAQFMQPGSPSIWMDPRDKESPAERLAALGYDAVPALIATIEDTRWTRTVGYWRQFTFSHYVVTVGDAALDVIEKIAGRSFWQGNYTAASMAKDGQASETRLRVEAWWKEFLEKGERQKWIDELVSGGSESHGALRHLLSRYPADVPDAVVRALPALKGRDRFYVIQGLDEVADPRVIELELIEATSGPTLECRVRAALNAHDQGHPEMRETLLAEWAAALRSPPWSTFDFPFGFSLLAGFLLSHAGPEGVTAVAVALPRLPAEVAAHVIDRVGSGSERKAPATRASLEDLLARLLDETASTGSTSSEFQGAIRLCDVAAAELAKLLDDRGGFDGHAIESARDRQIDRMRAAWRARRSLPPLAAVERQRASKPSEVVGAVASGLPADLTRSWNEMKAKPLDPAAVVAILRATFGAAPSGRVRVRMTIQRSAGDGGLSASIETRTLLGDLEGESWHCVAEIRGARGIPTGLRAVQSVPPGDPELDRIRDMLRSLVDAPIETDVVFESNFTRQPASR